MRLSLLVGRVCIALLVAWLESVSVLVFVWNAFYIAYPIACCWSLLSVFVLSSYGAFRNTAKIQRLFVRRLEHKNLHMNLALSFLVALVGFLSKRFVLMVYFPPTVWLESLSVAMVLLYSTYTMLNTFADMKEFSTYLVFPRTDMVKGARAFYSGSHLSIALYCALFYATMVRAHYKVLEVSISIASLIKKYGGIYHSLHYTRRLICFPIIGIGLYNINRCAGKIKQMGSEMESSFGFFESIWIMMMFSAACSYGFASKVRALSADSIIPAICVGFDKAANYCRQGADALPCHNRGKA